MPPRILTHASELPDAANNPVVVWTVVACACATAIILAVAKLVSPVGEALEQRRQIKQRAEDARIRDLSEQVDHLAGRVYTLETNATRQDRYLLEHAKWDHEMQMAAISAGLEVPDPPPLRPPFDP